MKPAQIGSARRPSGRSEALSRPRTTLCKGCAAPATAIRRRPGTSPRHPLRCTFSVSSHLRVARYGLKSAAGFGHHGQQAGEHGASSHV
eukprot:scaffold5586_cov124-Isochrysis_galbana.AAC.10